METIVLFSLLVGILLLGAPVSVAMILSSAASLALSNLPINVLAERLLGAINSYTLMAVPFFIAAAVIMNRSGVTRHILDFAACLIGHRRGGTAQVNVLASLFFSGMSGSATADVASQGRMLIPRMKQEGYDAPFAAGVTAAASIISSIVPPSIIMIIYGSVTNTSIGGLFFGGIIPGIILFVFLIVIVHVLSVRRGYPKGERQSWKQTLPVMLRALPALFAPVLILGGIRFGMVTPTEAGVIACVYGLFLGTVVYREITPRSFVSIMEESVVATAVPMFIIASSASFGFALTVTGFGFMMNEIMTGMTENPVLFMIITLLALFAVGLFLESTSALLIFVPLFAPLAQSYGIPDIQYGLLMIVALMLGTLTPPVGLQSFIASDIADISIVKIDIWYFIAAILAVGLLIALFPLLTMFLPSTFI
ncbi:TRAP transporter large permease [Nitratireductor sp. StC3]|uniref:TRAP transporter large permease n=1 Tax=Nitratireductor sp. StC3 TaxID=2126741 RepID=UPI000D0DACC8|nr:TRAP transporter large permease [Nitratireductor sp. StC3]PSM19229.1 ABC transporter permease [Nitratireductor sp. StC3]